MVSALPLICIADNECCLSFLTISSQFQHWTNFSTVFFIFQMEVINSHKELLPLYLLLGRLVQKFSELSDKCLQHYGKSIICWAPR